MIIEPESITKGKAMHRLRVADYLFFSAIPETLTNPKEQTHGRDRDEAASWRRARVEDFLFTGRPRGVGKMFARFLSGNRSRSYAQFLSSNRGGRER
jgi:hypothetical protein